MSDAAAAPFGILVVCTGNIARSPAAERLLAPAFGVGVEVRSAGTHARAGRPIAASMVPLMESASAVAHGFTSRQLTREMIRQAHLVFTMTRDQRADVVETWPGAVRRCFTLLEFARLLQSVTQGELPAGSVAGRLEAAIPLAAGHRQQVSGGPATDNIEDPYGREQSVYASTFHAIYGAVRSIGQIITKSID